MGTTSTTKTKSHPVRVENIPEELTKLEGRFVNWIWEKRYRTDGTPKWTKPPVQTNGHYAKNNDPSTWTNYDTAVAYLNRSDGIGVVFSAEDNITGIDLDNCRDPITGELSPMAQDIVTTVNTYTEVSPSGEGVKLIFRGKSGIRNSKDHDLGIEVFSHSAYFTLTGRQLEGTPNTLEYRPDAIDWITAKYLRPSTVSERPSDQKNTTERGNLTTVWENSTSAMDDVELARQALYSIPASVADDYDKWLKIGMACKSISPALKDDWDRWSRRSDKYVEGDCARRWASFNGSGVKPGTLYHFAMENGWTFPVATITTTTKSGEEECPATSSTEVPRSKIQYTRITSAELDSGCFELEYRIPGVLVAGQPMIVAGPQKSLKTSLLIAMAVALATCAKFLGYFQVVRAARVCVMSGESGLATLQETARRICKSICVKLADLSIIWSPDLPRFDSPEHLEALAQFLQDDEIEVLIIDPAYLTMPAADAGNLMAQGMLLRNITETCRRVGVQLILAHHTKKHRVGERFEPLSLEDIAWAGFQEFARQWLLINRREEYEPGSGEHRMWLSTGGSAGHGGLYALDVSEGVLTPETTRTWDVSVSTATNARKETQKRKDDRKAKELEERDNEYRARLKTALQKFPEGETPNILQQLSGLNAKAFSVALGMLHKEGRVEACTVKRKNKQTYEAWKYVEPGTHSDTPTDSDSTPTDEAF